jgi:hypothetical protein
LAFWLSFTSSLFKQLKAAVPASSNLDKRSLSADAILEDLDNLDPVTKFFHELISLTFDIYSVLLINLYNVRISEIVL